MSKNSELMPQQMQKQPDMRLVVEREENPPVIHEKRNDAAAPQAFLKLAEGISLSVGKESPWFVVLAEIDSGEGCSRVVAQAAKILALSGLRKVCLVDAVKNWLDELRREFDSVHINAPPLNRSADGIAFGKLADGLVPELEASTTQASVARRVVENLRSVHLRIVGAVLNQCPRAKDAAARGEP